MVGRPLNLLLIDGDPILRLGLQAALDARSEVRAIASCETLALGTVALAEQRQSGRLLPDVVVLNLTAALAESGLSATTAALARYRREFPGLPLLAIDHQHPATLGAWAQRQGFAGYWTRSQSLDGLVDALGRVAQGQQVWTLAEQGLPPRTPVPPARLGLWSSTVASGLRQVQQQLNQLEQQRRQASWVERLWMDGARRELRTTQWLLRTLSATAATAVTPPSRASGWGSEGSSSVPLRQPLNQPAVSGLGEFDNGRERRPTDAVTSDAAGGGSDWGEAPPETEFIAPETSPARGSSASGSPAPVQATLYRGGPALQALLLEHIARRMTPGLINLTGEPQEIDILTPEKRQELLSTVMRCFGDVLLDLRLSNPVPEQLPERRQTLLVDWWSKALGDFWGKYSTLALPEGPVMLLPILLREPERVSQAIFDHIPGVETVFSALVFGSPVAIDGVPYRPESPEAMLRLVQLTENLLIQLANGVMQPLLNNFADVDVIKQSFYDKRLLSTREIEKFRNNLSWKYRVTILFKEAQDIYESRYGLLNFVGSATDATVGDAAAGGAMAERTPGGIQRVSFYAPRRGEMVRLNTFQQTVTLALEVRDAVAPRLEVLAGWLGSGVVYVLTQILGRGIGLIGRGVIQGVGSSLQDVRKMRKGRDS